MTEVDVLLLSRLREDPLLHMSQGLDSGQMIRKSIPNERLPIELHAFACTSAAAAGSTKSAGGVSNLERLLATGDLCASLHRRISTIKNAAKL